MSSSAADAPGRAAPGPEAGQESVTESDHESDQVSGRESAQAAPPGASAAGTAGSGTPRRGLATGLAIVAVAAAMTGVFIAFARSSTSPPAGPAVSAPATTGTGAAGHAVVADEAAATVAVVATGGTITGGPVIGPDGRLWLVESSQTAHQPVLAVVNPLTYAVSTHPLPASIGGLSLRYTGAAAFDGTGQLWLGATETAPGKQPTGILVQYAPGTGAATQFPVLGGCTDLAAQPAQLFSASDGAVWVECAASGDPAATYVFRLSSNGAIVQPYIANYLNQALRGTSLWNEIAGLSQAKIGPLVPAFGGTMWGLTPGGAVQFTSLGTETFTPAGPGATELETQAPAIVGPLQLTGNGLSAWVGGIGDCRLAGAPAAQARECAVTVDPLGNTTMTAAVPGDDGQAGQAVHPAGADLSGDVWFIVDGTAGGRAPAGQYLFEATEGGGARVVPFSVPGRAAQVSGGQTPVVTASGAVWMADPAAGPGALVAVMPTDS